jgi:prepilin-type N-terminal cleavage/methylation domain-containing protein
MINQRSYLGKIIARKMKKNNNSKGFTLIELLVVIAIIAILAVVVVLTLNPAQLLAQSRDSNRVSDMATLKSAIALYQADQATTTLGTSGVLQTAYVTALATTTYFTTTSTGGWYGYQSADISSVATSSARGIAGTGSGWLPIPFASISSGAPFGSLPIDPLGTTANTACNHGIGGTGVMPCLYTFLSNTSGQYKLAVGMESSKYGAGNSGDVVSGDGGNSTSSFETGSLPTL